MAHMSQAQATNLPTSAIAISIRPFSFDVGAFIKEAALPFDCPLGLQRPLVDLALFDRTKYAPGTEHIFINFSFYRQSGALTGFSIKGPICEERKFGDESHGGPFSISLDCTI